MPELETHAPDRSAKTADASAVPVALPAVQPKIATPAETPTGRLHRWRGWLLAGLVVVLGGTGGGWYWWGHRAVALPAGIVWGNGRIEADDIDITPKYAGRVLALLVDEGDLVQAGQIVARMDTRDTEATLLKVEAQQRQAERSLDAASDDAVQQKTEQKLAQQQVDRTKALLERGFSTRELLDQRQQAVDGDTAKLNSATAKVGEAEHALAAAAQDVALYKITMGDGVLVARRAARVQYRLVNTGEVVAAGAKIFTLLDLSNVYMTVRLLRRPIVLNWS